MVSVLTSFLAVVFAWAALAKLIRLTSWRAALGGYGLSPRVVATAAWGVPAIEFGAALLLLFGPPRAGAAAALALLAAFSAAILRATSLRGKRLPCGCFGGDGRRDFRVMLARNVLLGLPAAALVLFPDAALLGADLGSGEIVPVVLTAAALGLVAWVLLQAFPDRSRRR